MKITQRQLDGISILLVFSFIIIFGTNYFTSQHSGKCSIDYVSANTESVIVEVSPSDTKLNCILSLPKNSTVSDALKAAHIKYLGNYEKKLLEIPLSSGKCIEIEPVGHIKVREMSASKKLIMDVPININQSTLNDLMLIPGVGRKTAERILQFRRTNGGIKNLEELMQINGIQLKRYMVLKKHLCVE
jgi:competence ComEA-like helix-hairpin-helix protein